MGFYISPGKHGRIHRDKYSGARQADAGVHRDRRRSADFPDGVHRNALRHLRIRDRRRLSREAAESGAAASITGLPIPGQRRNRARGLRAAGQHGAGGTVRRMDRLLRREDAPRAGARHQSDLPPQRSDHPRLPAAAAAGGTGALSRRHALGAAQAGAEEAGVPDVVASLVPRGRRIAQADRGLDQAALSGPCQPGGPARRHVPLGAYGGKYVIVVDEDIDVSNLDELMWAVCSRSDPGDFDRHHPRCLVDAARSVDQPERKEKGNFTNCRAIIDACRPFHWKDQYPIVNMPLPETARKTKEMFSWMLDGIDQKTRGTLRPSRMNKPIDPKTKSTAGQPPIHDLREWLDRVEGSASSCA